VEFGIKMAALDSIGFYAAVHERAKLSHPQLYWPRHTEAERILAGLVKKRQHCDMNNLEVPFV
jgi:hypothetical protein